MLNQAPAFTNHADAGFDGSYRQHTTVDGSTKRSKEARTDITIASFFMIIPMLLLTALLLSLVLIYRIDSAKHLRSHFTSDQTHLSEDAFYVNVNSTFLIFVASWMSSLAPILVGCATALTTFPVAQNLFHEVVEQNRTKALTPSHLALILRVMNGSSWVGIWGLIKYRCMKGPLLRGDHALTALIVVTLLSIGTSVVIFGADTWLHIATSTVTVAQLSTLSLSSTMYSLSLTPDCTATNNSAVELFASNKSCAVYAPPDFEDYGSSVLLVDNAAAVFQALNNQSTQVELQTYSNQTSNGTFAYLSVAQSNPHDDFTATTFAIRTTCKPMTQACNMTTSNVTFNYLNGTQPASEVDPETTFNCSDSFYSLDSYMDEVGHRYRYASDPNITNLVSYIYGVENPVYLGFASLIQRSSTIPPSLANDPNVYVDESIVGAVVFCTIEAFDVEYDRVQNRVTRFQAHPSNSSVATALTALGVSTSLFMDYLGVAADTAAQSATSAQDLADEFALSVGKLTMSGGASTVQRAPALAAQRRTDILVARVPKAPLFLLVSMNALFILLGCILLTLAARTSRQDKEVRNRMTITGMVANLFEHRTADESMEAIESLLKRRDEYETAGIGADRFRSEEFIFQTLHGRKEGFADIALTDSGNGSVSSMSLHGRYHMDKKSPDGHNAQHDWVYSNAF